MPTSPLGPVTAERAPDAAAGFEPSPLDARIDDVRLNAVPLNDAIEWLRHQTTATIDVDWAGLATVGIDREKPVTVRARDIKVFKAIQLCIKSLDVEDASEVVAVQNADRSRIKITSRRRWLATAVAVAYDISDLVNSFPPDQRASRLDDIKQFIMQNVDQPDWKANGGEVCDITVGTAPNVILVIQTPEDQPKIAEALDSLRRSYEPPSRFPQSLDPAIPVTKPSR